MFYGHTPSLVLAVLGSVLFFLGLLVHTYQLVKYKTWFFVPVALACLMEMIGYLFRAFSSKIDPYNEKYFIAQYTFFLLAPLFLSGSIFTILSKLLRVANAREEAAAAAAELELETGGGLGNRTSVTARAQTEKERKKRQKKYLPISPQLVLCLFLAADAMAALIQIPRAALIGNLITINRDAPISNYVLLGGLALQVATFLVFTITSVLFVYRARGILLGFAPPTPVTDTATFLNDLTNLGGVGTSGVGVGAGAGAEGAVEAEDPQEKKKIMMLRQFVAFFLLATILVFLRTCFRLAETAEGLGGKINTNEVYFGCLEFAPIVIAVIGFNVWHPGPYIPEVKKGRATTTEENGEGIELSTVTVNRNGDEEEDPDRAWEEMTIGIDDVRTRIEGEMTSEMASETVREIEMEMEMAMGQG